MTLYSTGISETQNNGCKFLGHIMEFRTSLTIGFEEETTQFVICESNLGWEMKENLYAGRSGICYCTGKQNSLIQKA